MVKDFLYITNRNSIDELNDVVESGMYMIIPGSDTYGTLLVFQAGVGAAGATVQRYFHPSGLNITRIKAKILGLNYNSIHPLHVPSTFALQYRLIGYIENAS